MYVTINHFKSLMFLIILCTNLLISSEEQTIDNLIQISSVNTFNPVIMGNLAKVNVKGKNISNQVLKINSIRSTCGCTASTPDKRIINPNEEFNINVSITTARKSGEFNKTLKIYFAGFKNPLQTNINGTILEHDKKRLSTQQNDIFSGTCAKCHIEQGINKTSYALYLADCAMCHGVFKEGASGPALNKDLDKKHLKNMISHGSKNQLMPGFSKLEKHSLTEAQINSLVEYIVNNTGSEVTSDVIDGSKLYKQFCSSCHQESREGAIGPSITYLDLKSESRDRLESLLKNGSSKSMPSFLKSKGGVLSEKQITALIDFLIEKPNPKKLNDDEQSTN